MCVCVCVVDLTVHMPVYSSTQTPTHKHLAEVQLAKQLHHVVQAHDLSFLQESPIILRDGNGTIYPMAKDCMGGIRDPDWLDLPPIASLGMGVHSLANLPSNSTIKKKAAIIIMAVEVGSTRHSSCWLMSWFWFCQVVVLYGICIEKGKLGF